MTSVKPKTWIEEAGAPTRKKVTPEGLWLCCPSCSAMLFKRMVENNLQVCPQCQHHFRLTAVERVKQLIDPGSFESMDEKISSDDPLLFEDLKPRTFWMKNTPIALDMLFFDDRGRLVTLISNAKPNNLTLLQSQYLIIYLLKRLY